MIKLRLMAQINNRLRQFRQNFHDEHQKRFIIQQCDDGVYEHIKTGKTYISFGDCINVTNSSDGEVMVLYTDGNKVYVREKHEFNEKFKKK